jgi:hypothetical protein
MPSFIKQMMASHSAFLALMNPVLFFFLIRWTPVAHCYYDFWCWLVDVFFSLTKHRALCLVWLAFLLVSVFFLLRKEMVSCSAWVIFPVRYFRRSLMKERSITTYRPQISCAINRLWNWAESGFPSVLQILSNCIWMLNQQMVWFSICWKTSNC